VGLAGAAYWYLSREEDKPKNNMGCLESKPDAEVGVSCFLPVGCACCPSVCRPTCAAPEPHGARPRTAYHSVCLAQVPEAKKARVETAAPAATNTAKPAATSAAKPVLGKKDEKKKEEFSWEKKKPDPKDFMFSNLKGQV
jgi:septal ring-binding cell division protein DamX